MGGGDVGGGRGGERAKNVYRAARFPYMYNCTYSQRYQKRSQKIKKRENDEFILFFEIFLGKTASTTLVEGKRTL